MHRYKKLLAAEILRFPIVLGRGLAGLGEQIKALEAEKAIRMGEVNLTYYQLSFAR